MTEDTEVISTSNGRAVSKWRTALVAVALAVGCGFIYLLIAGGFRFSFRQSSFTHHIWLADAFLHGQLYARDEVVQQGIAKERPDAARLLDRMLRERGLTMTPAEKERWIDERAYLRATHDWTIVDGRLYGYWGPLTAVMCMPWVALFGPGVSDLLIGAVVGMVNIGLFYWMMRRVAARRLLDITETCCIALTLLFAFGTVHFFLSCDGRVWFTSQLITLTMLLAAMLAALSIRPSVGAALLAGVFFGAAILGRNVAALTGLFFVVLFWQRLSGVGASRLKSFAARMLAFGIPCIAALAVQGWYNHARFGDAFESGQKMQILTSGEQRFKDDYLTYGQFHPHFLPTNFKYYFWNVHLIRRANGRYAPDPNGNSMFLITPPLVYVLLAWRQRRAFLIALLAGAVPVLIALMLFRATGYLQFGNRYLLDIIPLLLLLVAAGMRGRLTNVSYALIVLAAAANLYGTYWMCRPSFAPVKQWADWRAIAALIVVAAVGRAAFIASRNTANAE